MRKRYQKSRNNPKSDLRKESIDIAIGVLRSAIFQSNVLQLLTCPCLTV